MSKPPIALVADDLIRIADNGSLCSHIQPGIKSGRRAKMPHVEAVAKLPAGAAAVWREIGSFQGVGRWHPLLTKVEGEGEQPGSIRMPESREGQKQVERLRAIDPAQHFMRYEIVSSPMPIKDYTAELRAVDNGDGTSTVVWGGDFQVTSGDEQKTAKTIEGFLTAGLENLKKKYR